jgi:predicted ATP-dependent serine protease
MTLSICIICGTEKKRPIDKCTKCGFEPKTDEEKAKSLMLSTAYEINGEYRGKTVEELKGIAAEIQEKGRHEFDANEVKAVIAYAQQVLAIPVQRLIIDGLRWIVPPIAILAIVYVLLLLKR